MSNEEHLIENTLSYIENIGWENFDEDNPEDLKKARLSIENSELVDDKTLLWLIKMAIYVEYSNKVWGIEV